jgi:hypothetical protein
MSYILLKANQAFKDTTTNDVGFDWEAKKSADAASWQERYKKLGEYMKRSGNCNIPQKIEENLQLGVWVYNQRQAFKQGKLSRECIGKLDAL